MRALHLKKVVELHASVMRRKYVIFAVWWGITTIIAIIYACYWGIKPHSICYQTDNGDVSVSQNQLTGLTYYRYDPNTNKLRFSVSVGMILTQNAQIGIFKTAAARTIKVKDLQLRFCESSDSQAMTAMKDNTLPEKIIPGDNGFKEIISRVVEARKHWGVDIDLSNPIEVAIDNLDCQIFDGDNLRLAVQCRRAIVNSSWPLVTLRGHIIITAANGSTLETNRVKWDIKKQSFTTDETYVLRQSGIPLTGKGVCVDSQLNIIELKNERNLKRRI
jgi:hypothetical protein